MNMHSVQVARSAQRPGWQPSQRMRAAEHQARRSCHQGSLPRATGMAASILSHMFYH